MPPLLLQAQIVEFNTQRAEAAQKAEDEANERASRAREQAEKAEAFAIQTRQEAEAAASKLKADTRSEVVSTFNAWLRLLRC